MAATMNRETAQAESTRANALGYMTHPTELRTGSGKWVVYFTGYGSGYTPEAVAAIIAAGRVPRLAAEYEARLAAARAAKAAAI